MHTLRFKVEYYVLWDDHTWEDGHMHELSMEAEDITEVRDDEIMAFANEYGTRTLMGTDGYRKAVLLVPVSHEQIDEGGEEEPCPCESGHPQAGVSGRCRKCNAQIFQDEHGTWVDNSGGDVCGADGENTPHIPEDAQ